MMSCDEILWQQWGQQWRQLLFLRGSSLKLVFVPFLWCISIYPWFCFQGWSAGASRNICLMRALHSTCIYSIWGWMYILIKIYTMATAVWSIATTRTMKKGSNMHFTYRKIQAMQKMETPENVAWAREAQWLNI